MSQYKTKIAELPLITAADSTTIIPVSTGTPLATKKIKADDLIKGTATIAAKANLAGGNSFTGVQNIDGSVVIAANKSISSPRVDTSILNIEATGDGIWSDDVHVMTRAELLYLTGLTSNVQTQLNARASLSGINSFSGSYNAFTNYITLMSGGITIGGGVNGKYIESREDNLTIHADFGILSLIGDDGIQLIGETTINGLLDLTDVTNISTGSNTISLAELSTLDGVTSSIQTQLAGKAGLTSNNTFSGAQTVNGAAIFNAGVSINNLSSITGDIVVGNTNEIRIYDGVSNEIVEWTEVQKLQGITSNIQDQLDTKVSNPYKVYSCILTQEDNFSPSVTAGTVVNEFNTDFSWTYLSSGLYRLFAISDDPFTENKTVLIQNGSTYYAPTMGGLIYITGERDASNSFYIRSNIASTGLPANGIIESIHIEIRVYN